MTSLKEVFKIVIKLLKKEQHPYMVIGGIAAAVLGYPRMTNDVDICISIKKKDVASFLKQAENLGFTYDSAESLKKARDFGVFKVFWKEFHIDFIITSTEFEKTALSRAKEIKVYGVNALFPTPEDLILLKAVPGRAIDIADIEYLTRRHRSTLDTNYLELWAQKLADEAEDMRIYTIIQRALLF